VAFGGSGIIRGVAFGGSGIIRGVAFGGSDLIKEGLHILAYIQICFILFYYFFLVCIYFNLFFIFFFIKESKCFCFDDNAHRDTSCAETPCGFNNELLCIG
jgi:hypothetical protein